MIRFGYVFFPVDGGRTGVPHCPHGILFFGRTASERIETALGLSCQTSSVGWITLQTDAVLTRCCNVSHIPDDRCRFANLVGDMNWLQVLFSATHAINYHQLNVKDFGPKSAARTRSEGVGAEG